MSKKRARAIRCAVASVELLESRKLLTTVPMTGTSGSDAFIVSYDPSSLMYSFSGGSTSPVSVAASDLTSFSITGAGGSDTLTIEGGSPTLSNDANADGTNLSIEVTTGSSLSIDSTEHLSALTVDAGAAVTMLGNGSRVLVANSLSVAGSTNNWLGVVDLTNNDLIVHNGNLPTLNNQIKSGFDASAGGTWQGEGITSSAAATDTTHLTSLGVIQNSTDGSTTGTALYGSFASETVVNTDVLVGYTFFGDANLSGHVDGSDYSRIDSAYLDDQSSQNAATGWFNGDFNYDQSIDGSDYTLIDNAFNTQGGSLPTGPVGSPAPTAPTGLSATAVSSGEIDLVWSNTSALATENDILISDNGINFSYFDQTTPNATSYQATGLDAATTYYFEVASVNAGGTVDSNIASANTNPITTPTALSTNVVSSTEIDLMWGDSATDNSGYEIDWSTDGTTFDTLDTVAAGTDSYQAQNLTPGTDYTFQVTSLADNGSSDSSSQASAQTIPATPTGLNAVVNPNGVVNLTWNAVAGDNGYTVQSSTGGGWTQVGMNTSTPSITDSPAPGAALSYRVSAFDVDGSSDFSQTIQLSVIPAAPSGLTAVLNPDNSVALSWTDNSSNETGFKIEQSSDGINYSTATTVGANTTQYNASGLSLASVYSFRIASTNAAGDSLPSNSATIAMPLERVIVPSSGAIVYSQTKLLNGEPYTIRASGSVYLGVPPDGYGDAEYGSFVNPQNNGAAQYGSIDYGIAINDPTVTSSKTPFWGAYTPTHVYTSSFTGLGQTIEFNYHDDFPADNVGSLSADILDPYTVGMTAYQTGDNFGTPVSNSVKQSGDPSQYVVLVDDDYQVHPDFSVADNGSATADLDGTDTDLAKITLNQIPSYLTTGTVSLSLSNSSSVRLFKSDGTQLSSSDMTMNLASPSGYLAGLTSGSVDVWVQGMSANPDLVFKLGYKDTNGHEVARDTVHMMLVDWQFVGKSGNALTSVDRTAEQLLIGDSTGDPTSPIAADSVSFKNQILGLPTSDVTSLTVVSDSVSTDMFTDSFAYNSSNTTSADWATIYTPIAGGPDLTSTQISFLQQHDDLNVVHNPQGDGVLVTKGGSFHRHLTAKQTADAQSIYNLLTSDPTYGSEAKFLLDRMDYNGTGADYLHRLVFQSMSPLPGDPIYYSKVANGYIYIEPGGTDAETKNWAMNGLREWAADGSVSADDVNKTGQALQNDTYFTIIARQYARSFYWTVDPHTLPWGETLTKPKPKAHAAYTGTVSPNAVANAAVVSLAQTFSFLYLFSKASSPANSLGDTSKMYPASLYTSLVGNYTHNDLVTQYLYVFTNRVDSLAHGGTIYEVNIPSAGMNFDYYEKDTTDPTNAEHNTSPVATGPYAGSWPDEDQLHHFVGYFFTGALFQLSPFTNEQKYLIKALKATGDYYVRLAPNAAPTLANTGDYDLGIMAWDLGVAYQTNPTDITQTITTYLTDSFAQVNALDGRGGNLP